MSGVLEPGALVTPLHTDGYGILEMGRIYTVDAVLALYGLCGTHGWKDVGFTLRRIILPAGTACCPDCFRVVGGDRNEVLRQFEILEDAVADQELEDA